MHLWQSQPHLTQHQAEVLACTQDGAGFSVRTSPTLLYPEGGGQPADRGWLGTTEVVDVQWDGSEVVHRTLTAVPTGPSAVRLDWARRFDHMQQHSAQHLLTALVADQLGWQTVSFHLGAAVCDVELDTDRVDAAAMVRIEALVNAAIREARPVRQREVSADELGRLPVRSRGLPEGFSGLVRLVEIDGLDLNTCGGTHVAHTGELQAVAVLGAARARKGVTRLSFVAGGRVLDRVRRAEQHQGALSRLLCGGPDERVALLERVLEDRKHGDRRLKAAQGELATALAEVLAARPGPVVHLSRPADDSGFLATVASALAPQLGERLALLTGGEGAQGCFVLVGPAELVALHGPEVAARLDGRGGGARGRYQGKVARPELGEAVAAWLATV